MSLNAIIFVAQKQTHGLVSRLSCLILLLSFMLLCLVKWGVIRLQVISMDFADICKSGWGPAIRIHVKVVLALHLHC